jgi:hypothetical protein
MRISEQKTPKSSRKWLGSLKHTCYNLSQWTFGQQTHRGLVEYLCAEGIPNNWRAYPYGQLSWHDFVLFRSHL